MSRTVLGLQGQNFTINGRMTYQNSQNSAIHGLLMNARFIQAIFDDRSDPRRYDRFGRAFSPDKNTDDFVKCLPEWYDYGLRAFTVGLQGGGPCFTISNSQIDNNPYSEDGTAIDAEYLKRLDKVIEAADQIGMVVIVSCFYPGQVARLKDDRACINAIKAVANHLRDRNYTNIIIEPCNEHNIRTPHPVVCTDAGMTYLMDVARRESGGMPVGCSGTGGYFSEAIVKASDVILIHGNGQTRNELHRLIMKCRATKPDTPIVVNEDSQDYTNLDVCVMDHASWGYYNNMTKQEPPADWSITPGEDRFFATRMAKALGLQVADIPQDAQFVLQGFEHKYVMDTERYDKLSHAPAGSKAYFVRLSALYPEKIDHVEFYIGDERLDVVYDTPYMLNMQSNWLQDALIGDFETARKWARVTLRDGSAFCVDAQT